MNEKLFDKLGEVLQNTSVEEVVDTLSYVAYRNAAVKGDAGAVKVADYLRTVASNIGTGKLTVTVAGASGRKAVTSAANGRKGGRPKGSKNKPKEVAANDGN